MWLQLLYTGIWEGEIWDRRKNGKVDPKSLRITALKDLQGNITGYVAIYTDITERKQAEKEIRNLAFYDTLTRLPNRRLLLDRLALALSVSERSRQYGALLFLDMDNFKTLNDILGHNVGDQMLIEVAERIKYAVRKVDTVSRFGGDEFVVLFEDLSFDGNEASQKMAVIAEKIRTALVVPFRFNQHVHNSSSSIGVCLFFGHTLSCENLIKQADIAMYQAKSAGRNRVQFYDPVLQQSAETRVVLESDLRKALSLKQFQLYYQIQCDSNMKTVGAEALIRWHHPVRGMIAPMQFISIAEESTLIQEIGFWVIETACQQLVLWSKKDDTRDLVLAINVSARQFMMTDFVELVQSSIQFYGADPSRLKLELTESVILHNIEDIVNKMQLLKTFGIKLSLDDFGTGYSSLSYLKQLPIDQIKIDQSFVRDIANDLNDAVMVKNIIEIAKNFQLNVIAEGVETEEQLVFLRENGCMAYQGYLFGKPLPIEQFEKSCIK
jgi:diguanylate cyclase (GGDEF)-like protein